ncbi:hypothetical protein K469DRAFT_546814, partial [Zopfia rhizophila CBS 207.26]
RCIGHIINLIAKQALFGNDFEKFEVELQKSTQDIKEEMQLRRKQGPTGLLHTITK